MKPTPFSVEEYVKWHEACRKTDKPLLAKLEKLRAKLMTTAKSDLEFLDLLLAYMFTYSGNEYTGARGAVVTYQTPLSVAVRAPASSALYEALFKSIPSIVNKMWRKSEDTPAVTMANILHSITDLIRTDIRTETLDSAQFLAARMNRLPHLIYDTDIKAQFTGRIDRVAFEPEMKMASGYFAYHGLVHFRSGYIVEVQIYSGLMSEWRKLSHLLYERVRVEPITQHEFASKEARLISLGHALHLAECEIQRLRQEMEKK